MKISKEQFGRLQSAGFTVREINVMQQKFYNLLNTAPVIEPMPLRHEERCHQCGYTQAVKS